MTTTALLVIDVQNDYFPGGSFPLDRMEAVGANVARLLASFRAKQWPVLHIRHVNPAGAPLFAEGTPGAEIHPLAAPQPGEPVVIKHHVNCYRDTNLKALLDERDVPAVVICGAMTLMCVDAATRASADFGYACTVVHDACAARALEFNGVTAGAAEVQAAFLAALAMGYAKVVATDQMLG